MGSPSILSWSLFLLLMGRQLVYSADPVSHTDAVKLQRRLDPTYRPPPMWGCEAGLPDGAFHVVVATYAPEPMALVPWIWNLGLTGAQIWIYHRLDSADPRVAAATAALAAFEPYPCNSSVRLQQLLPNKGREAAVYMSHIVRHYIQLPEGIAFVHDHGPAARHSLCGPFFRRVRGYYAGIREKLLQQGKAVNTTNGAAGIGVGVDSVNNSSAGVRGRQRSLAARSSRSRSGGGSAVRQLLAQFADRVVSLSSGCQENWLKGCCALLVCAEDGEQAAAAGLPEDPDYMAAATSGGFAGAGGATTLDPSGSSSASSTSSSSARMLQWQAPKFSRGRCPFRTSRCLANASALSIPLSRVFGSGRTGSAASRWLYMHGGGGLYDTRYENLVVLYGETPEAAAAAASAGLSNGGFGPLSLVRYAGSDAVETVRAATSSSRALDYPEGSASRTPQETYAELGRILQAHDFATRKAPGNFKSCCASLMLRPHHIRQWPLSMYEQILSYTLDDKNTYHASLAVSHHGWAMWSGSETGPSDLLRYFEVDLALLHIRGCPGWRMEAVVSEQPGGLIT